MSRQVATCPVMSSQGKGGRNVTLYFVNKKPQHRW